MKIQMKSNVTKLLHELFTVTTEQDLQRFYWTLRWYREEEEELYALLGRLADIYPDLPTTHQRVACLLSLFLYDMLPQGEGWASARACANLLLDGKDLMRPEGRSWSEVAWCKLCRQKGFPPTSMQMTENPPFLASYTPYFEYGFEIVPEERIAYCRDEEGALLLVQLVEEPNAILCDEDPFNDEPPLYFTKYSHFISPVYKLKLLRAVMSELLRKKAYPYIRIRLMVIYVSSEVSLLNEADMEKIWKQEDVEILLNSRDNNIRFPIGVKSSGEPLPFPKLLCDWLTGVRQVYRQIPIQQLYSLEDILIAFDNII